MKCIHNLLKDKNCTFDVEFYYDHYVNNHIDMYEIISVLYNTIGKDYSNDKEALYYLVEILYYSYTNNICNGKSMLEYSLKRYYSTWTLNQIHRRGISHVKKRLNRL